MDPVDALLSSLDALRALVGGLGPG